VVDYGSTKPIKVDDLPDTKKIKIIRVEGTDDWRIGHASNIGADYATNRYICKFDSDVIVEKSDWLQNLNLTNSFFRGHFQTPVPNGEVILSKEHWLTVGGYHEWLSGYGFDDADFYIRLKSIGLEERYIPPTVLHTLKHTQESRGDYKQSYRFMRVDDPSTKAMVDQYRNTLLSLMQRWHHELRSHYAVVSDQSQLITVKTEHFRDTYKFQDAIAEGIAALRFISTDETTRRHVEGLMAWHIKEAGGFGQKPDW
jgi:hypothetical protein